MPPESESPIPDSPVPMPPFPAKRLAAAWGRFVEQMSRNPQLWIQAAQEAQQRQLQIMAGITPTHPTHPGSVRPNAASPKPAPAASPKPASGKSGKTPDGEKSAPTAPAFPPPNDRRFADPAWRESPFHAFLAQSYLVNGDLMRQVLDNADLPEDDRKLLRFFFERQIAALSPANFAATNPEVAAAAARTGGQSLADGARNFARDLQRGTVSNTDRDAFRVGETLAATPGKIVADNGLVQLVQYAPAGPKVRARPVLVVPPCINKYYILDLQPENSLVRNLVADGFQVFLVSWANAGPEHSKLGWDDYLRRGVMDSLETVRAIGGNNGVNAMGFCVGGTLLASALAVLADDGKKGADSLTLLASMLDFSDAGEIGLFMDDEVAAEYDRRFASGGLVDGRDLARGFAALRPNDLVWPYVVGNYLKGEKPPAFDLLFWNDDPTNLPGPMFCEYLRHTYLNNKLARGESEMCGVKIDLRKVKCPTFVVASERDHIVPWKTAYASARLLGGTAKFCLSSSGHIAGIVNPPAKKKGWRMQVSGNAPLPENPDAWVSRAKKVPGSWWDDWRAWLAKRSGAMVPAPKKFGDARHPPLQDAPGDYVVAPRPETDNDGSGLGGLGFGSGFGFGPGFGPVGPGFGGPTSPVPGFGFGFGGPDTKGAGGMGGVGVGAFQFPFQQPGNPEHPGKPEQEKES